VFIIGLLLYKSNYLYSYCIDCSGQVLVAALAEVGGSMAWGQEEGYREGGAYLPG
jgi:hypothetical protein